MSSCCGEATRNGQPGSFSVNIHEKTRIHSADNIPSAWFPEVLAASSSTGNGSPEESGRTVS
ncbi:Hypothetical predicted protein, partial [Marmota monax]